MEERRVYASRLLIPSRESPALWTTRSSDGPKAVVEVVTTFASRASQLWTGLLIPRDLLGGDTVLQLALGVLIQGLLLEGLWLLEFALGSSGPVIPSV